MPAWISVWCWMRFGGRTTGAAEERDRQRKQPWKQAERAAFLHRLQQAKSTRLLEIGAGTGQDSEFFADAGLKVVATDISPVMVAPCRDKGLDAQVMDFSEPGLADRLRLMSLSREPAWREAWPAPCRVPSNRWRSGDR
jgi:SAM-dependent methyltransferase